MAVSLRSLVLVPLVMSLGVGLGLTTSAQAEVLVRWDQADVPSRESLGLLTLVVPAKNATAVQRALAQGYGVYLEVEAAALAGLAAPASGVAGIFVKGTVSAEQLTLFKKRIASRRVVVRTLDERGKWPHVRANWVTNNKGVLQVSSRTAQPWVENNAALIRIAQVLQPDATPLLTYPWVPVTLSDKDEGPSVEHYLVAIAEAGSFGADLVLPLHERLQQRLLLGIPEARAAWTEIRDYAKFYAGNLPTRYQPTANIAVVTGDPLRWFEVMNLLARHNLYFAPVLARTLVTRDLSAFDLLIALDAPDSRQLEILAAFAKKGGTVVLPHSEAPAAGVAQGAAEGAALGRAAAGAARRFPGRGETPVAQTEAYAIYQAGQGRVVEMRQAIANPDTFALDVRQWLGREKRAIDLWNGITVLTARYAAPDGETMMLTATNYAQQALPVQIRIPGLYSVVQYESPDEPVTRVPYQHREGSTEFVLPALRVGGRVFLTRDLPAKATK